ncbi:peptidoglycan recognition protein 1-like isoform X4 [Dendrobates tinctorius]|uniref:peptidoglycan recognition protein 1-like isoform X4 n=1 Tax=Dendrobates tinctorius TaxID=92724 RepID=UPI003CC97177
MGTPASSIKGVSSWREVAVLIRCHYDSSRTVPFGRLHHGTWMSQYRQKLVLEYKEYQLQIWINDSCPLGDCPSYGHPDLPDKGLLHRTSCPTIVTRAQWGGKNPTCRSYLRTPVPNVIIHHTEGAFCNSRTTCSAQVRNIQNYHMKSRGWCDIGYNFLIGEDGLVYEGRGWTTLGAHATSYNPISTGISVIGSFTDRAPNSAALNATRSLIACGVSKNFIKGSYALKGHRNVMSTSCPGNSLYRVIQGWPHFKA